MNLVGTDVLGDSTSLTVDNIRITNRVKQPSLSVIYVSHYGHDRRSWGKCFVVFLLDASRNIQTEAFEQLSLFIFRRDNLDLVAKLFTKNLEGIFV